VLLVATKALWFADPQSWLQRTTHNSSWVVTSLVLASASLRRSELLRLVVPDFQVRPVDIDEEAAEDGAEDQSPESVALAVAVAKAEQAHRHPGEVLIASDTVVTLDGRSLGKPADVSAAAAMLEMLAGRDHVVTTAVVMDTNLGRWVSTVSATVRMNPAAAAEIDAYVKSGEPLDNAGGYAIQGHGSTLVASARGCYLTIVGFPLCAVSAMLSRAGAIDPVEEPVALCHRHARAIASRSPAAVAVSPHPAPAPIRPAVR